MLQENGTLIISLEKISYSKSRHRLQCLAHLEQATGHPGCYTKSLQHRHYDTSRGHQVLGGSCRSKPITINLLQQTLGPAQQANRPRTGYEEHTNLSAKYWPNKYLLCFINSTLATSSVLHLAAVSSETPFDENHIFVNMPTQAYSDKNI